VGVAVETMQVRIHSSRDTQVGGWTGQFRYQVGVRDVERPYSWWAGCELERPRLHGG